MPGGNHVLSLLKHAAILCGNIPEPCGDTTVSPSVLDHYHFPPGKSLLNGTAAANMSLGFLHSNQRWGRN